MNHYYESIPTEELERMAKAAFEKATKKIQYNEVIEMCSQLILRNPNEPIYYNNRGFLQFKIGKIRKAIADYNKVIDIRHQKTMMSLDSKKPDTDSEKPSDKAKDVVSTVVFSLNRAEALLANQKYYEASLEYGIAISENKLNTKYHKTVVLNDRCFSDYSKYPDLYFLYNLRGLACALYGNLYAAIDNMLKAIQLKPNQSILYEHLGNMLNADKQYEGALECYNVAIDLDRNVPDYYRKRAQVFTALHMNKEAQTDISKADKLSKADQRKDADITAKSEDSEKAAEPILCAGYYYLLGLSYRHSRKHNEAIENFSRAIELAPCAKYYRNRAREFEEIGKSAEAADDYSKANELAPCAEYYKDLGDAFLKMDKFAEAADDYSKAIELEPSAKLYNSRGRAFYYAIRYPEAADDFSKAIELKSDEPAYYLNRGNALQAAGRISEAIADYNKAVELGGTPTDYKARAKALTKAGRYKEAVDDYNHAIMSENGFDAECYEWRGWLHMKLGKVNAAMADYAEAIRLNPSEPENYCDYGVMLYNLGRFDEAVICFTKAIEFAPDSDIELVVLNLKNRGNAYRELGRFEKAYADYALGAESAPENPDFIYLRGFAKTKTGDWDGAYADIMEAIRLKAGRSADSAYYGGLGDVMSGYERYDDAITYYGIAINLDPDYPEYYKSRAKAYTALGKIKEAKSDNDKAADLEKSSLHRDSDGTDLDATAEFEKPGRLMSYEEIANEILRRIKLKTLRKTAKMNLKRQKTTLINSKFGGLPFIPADGEYPKNSKTGEGLHFIMQINFAEMPPLPDFPTRGILQLFIADGDDLWEWAGIKKEEFNRQNKWRMLYYEDIGNPMAENEVKAHMPAAPKCLDYTPIFRQYGKDCLIEFEAVDLPITYGDLRCREMIVKYGADMLPKYDNTLKKHDRYLWKNTCVNAMLKSLNNTDNRVGGYPYNQQGDPREPGIVPKKYELLLQIQDAADENDNCIFNMGGPATFFIDPEDLKKRDFSKVYFYIDFD